MRPMSGVVMTSLKMCCEVVLRTEYRVQGNLICLFRIVSIVCDDDTQAALHRIHPQLDEWTTCWMLDAGCSMLWKPTKNVHNSVHLDANDREMTVVHEQKRGWRKCRVALALAADKETLRFDV